MRREMLDEAADAWIWQWELRDDFTRCGCEDCRSEQLRAAIPVGPAHRAV